MYWRSPRAKLKLQAKQLNTHLNSFDTFRQRQKINGKALQERAFIEACNIICFN